MSDPGPYSGQPAGAFAYRLLPELPPLAWLAIIGPSPVIEVLHGGFVEHTPRFFIEGAWAGSFPEGALLQSDCLFGSGGQILAEGVAFIPSIATTNALFHCIGHGEVLVSNSLPVLLWRASGRLDPGCFSYARINESIMRGIERYEPRIPLLHGEVFRAVHKNIVVRDGSVRIVDKPIPPNFNNFSEYYAYLESSFSRLVANARDPARRHPMRIFSTQSKGYDTTAINAMGAKLGIDACFTIRQGKGSHAFSDRDAATQTDDDGTDIGRALGLNIVPVERRAFEQEMGDERSFWAALHKNGDLNFVGIHAAMAQFSAAPAPALLLTGMLGELWYPTRVSRREALNNELMPWGLCSHGLAEVRLEIGYALAAIPFIGARQRLDILRITESDEMKPWSIGGDYDRPIPRRIAEEAGVPRELFGQRKIASMADFPPPYVPREKALRRRFYRFLLANRLISRVELALMPLVQRYNTFVTYSSPKQNLLAYYLLRAMRRISGQDRKPLAWSHLDGSVFCYCANDMADRYAASIPSAHIDPDPSFGARPQ